MPLVPADQGLVKVSVGSLFASALLWRKYALSDESLSNLQTVRSIDGQHGNGGSADRGTTEQP